VTVSSASGRYRLDKDSLEIDLSFTANATSTATVTASIPSTLGVTIDGNKVVSISPAGTVLGSGYVAAATNDALLVGYESSTVVNFIRHGQTSRINGVATIINTNAIRCRFIVPIAEWAGLFTD
jgi:hypothetical protein